MSAKYFHGCRLAAGTDPFAFSTRLRSVLNPVRDVLDAQLIADLAATRFDDAWVKGEPVPEGTALSALWAWEEEQATLPRPDSRFDQHSGHPLPCREGSTESL